MCAHAWLRIINVKNLLSTIIEPLENFCFMVGSNKLEVQYTYQLISNQVKPHYSIIIITNSGGKRIKTPLLCISSLEI